jgi:hypothetical protein
MFSAALNEESGAFLLLVDKIAALSKRDWKGRKEGAPVGDVTLKFKDNLQAYCFPFEGKNSKTCLSRRRQRGKKWKRTSTPIYLQCIENLASSQ